MKFEELLLQRSEEQQKRLALEEEVKKLQEVLEGEETLRNILECALNGSMPSHQTLSSLLPPQAQLLLSELMMIEQEISDLERKFDEMRLQLYQERAQVRELDSRQLKRLPKKNYSQLEVANNNSYNNINRSLVNDHRSRSQNYEILRNERVNSDRRASLSSVSDARSNLASSNRQISEIPRRVGGSKIRSRGIVKPNELSEQLVKCVIGIFLELNNCSTRTSLDNEEISSIVVPKITLSCMNSKGFIGKTPFSNFKSPTLLFNLNFDPYRIFTDMDSNVRDVGPYKNFVQLTSSLLDISRFPECLGQIGKLRVLMSKLCDVDLTYLPYKHKLAFWINIYNACIMHAFLEHGLPSTQENLLALMNKATLNVGGIVLNALAIEHFILRYPSESKNAPTFEKEMLLRHAYGLGYPEPNVTFALCRGTWSSPALRVYTAENIVNEMERAKVDYLEASIGVTNRKKILVPKLLQWHMFDFADDIESLLEWIYSQLPRSGSLKRLIMECLNGESKSPINKMVEVQPYESEFRYLLPSPYN